jgi:hypothetical protein
MPADPTPADQSTGATEPVALAAEPRDPDGQTPAVDSDDNTLADVSDGETPPDMTDTEMPAADDGETVPEVTDGEAVPEVTDDETVPDVTDDDTVPDVTDDDTVPDATDDETVPDATDDETVPDATVPDADDDRSREPLVPEPSGYQSRWDTIQAGFVDEPRRSVADADALVAEVIDEITDAFAGARAALEAQWSEGGEASTEDLRQAFRRYRSFFQRLLTT